MQLLKATVKESFRLNNIGSMNARQLKQDLVLDDYLIPKDVIFYNFYVKFNFHEKFMICRLSYFMHCIILPNLNDISKMH